MSATPVSFGQVQQIVSQRRRRATCRRRRFPGSRRRLQMLLNTSASIAQNAGRIYQQVAVTKIMPLGNVAQITDETRDDRTLVPRRREPN